MANDNHLTERGKFHANGKLLLTGEYLVIDGAAALALPLSLGQSLVVEKLQTPTLEWVASDINGVWFECDFSLSGFEIIKSTNHEIAFNLQNLLQKAAILNEAHPIREGLAVTTHLNFDRLFGLGSSSTLISLVADLFGTDKYKLHRMISGGSGYDVACASYNHPIIFQRNSQDEAVIKPLNFKPSFSEQICFVYLGHKQDTNKEISKYNSVDKSNIKQEIIQISDLTQKIAQVKDLTTFVSLIDLHEEITGRVLGRKGIKESKFGNFEGSIKSLGAWGGDFILAISASGEAYIKSYFAQYNIHTVLNFNNLILNEPVISGNEVIIRF